MSEESDLDDLQRKKERAAATFYLQWSEASGHVKVLFADRIYRMEKACRIRKAVLQIDSQTKHHYTNTIKVFKKDKFVAWFIIFALLSTLMVYGESLAFIVLISLLIYNVASSLQFESIVKEIGLSNLYSTREILVHLSDYKIANNSPFDEIVEKITLENSIYDFYDRRRLKNDIEKMKMEIKWYEYVGFLLSDIERDLDGAAMVHQFGWE